MDPGDERRDDQCARSCVIPGLVPGIQLSAGAWVGAGIRDQQASGAAAPAASGGTSPAEPGRAVTRCTEFAERWIQAMNAGMTNVLALVSSRASCPGSNSPLARGLGLASEISKQAGQRHPPPREVRLRRNRGEPLRDAQSSMRDG